MDHLAILAGLEAGGAFVHRHVGPDEHDIAKMLDVVGAGSVDDLIGRTVPSAIRLHEALDLPAPVDEAGVLAELWSLAAQNVPKKSLLGCGYHGTHTPPVILRNILENPGWYTAYTPYQAEISQGRLEALLNFQTMVADLTGLPVANASLLDEATAVAEGVAMAHAVAKGKSSAIAVATDLHPQTRAVLRTRATAVGLTLHDFAPGDTQAMAAAKPFAVVLQYPGTTGVLRDLKAEIDAAHAAGALAIVAADLLALCLLTPPGEMGADVVVGSGQRFGVAMGFGGPHAAFFATRDQFRRHMPGRIVGVSQDAAGQSALRLALQTREQHIRREKATSNICTAQVLLAIIAGFYAAWHGPDGLRRIATKVNLGARLLAGAAVRGGYTLQSPDFFDTITLKTGDAAALLSRALDAGFNIRPFDSETVCIAVDETVTLDDLRALATVLGGDLDDAPESLPPALLRKSRFLRQPVFNTYRSEHAMLRYMKRLEDRDIALNRGMIPLGSCTMKLNAGAEMVALSWPEFSAVHPFAPAEQTRHRLRRRQPATQRRQPGRIRRPADHPRLARQPRRVASRHLPYPQQRARHQPGQRRHGRLAHRGGRMRPERQHRPGGSARARRAAQGQAGGADGDLPQHARRVRRRHQGNLRHRARERRPGLHGWRQPERATWPHQPGQRRRRRVPPEFAQNILHPARRRRPRRRPHRGGAAFGGVPAQSSGADGCGSRGRHRPGCRGAVRQRADPDHQLRLYPHDGWRRPEARHRVGHSERELYRRKATAILPHSVYRRARLRGARMHPGLPRLCRGSRRAGGGYRQALAGLRVPRADHVVAGARHADGGTNRKRAAG
jgi:glycine cleavage system pyridoxal-binding protein P